MRIYNTLTREKEKFESIEENKVKMYVCGPTVYDYIHIGNARPYVVFDTVKRYLEYKGYEVNYVQNFTDVDDKIIKRANIENVSMEEISNRYIKETLIDVKSLNIKETTKRPRVTEEIPDIIEMIKTLIDKNYAYEKSGSVFYNTRSFEEYGKLANINIDDLEEGARVEVDEDKKNPSDFALWKASKENEPSWESPWGKGRPGWHIECSTMVRKYLGDTIDIHAGGEDLIFPHHENEIAQSEAVTGKPFAKYWLHNGFVNIDDEKMSKSKNNFFTLREITEKFHPEVVRFFILSSHYRNPLNFSEEILESSESSLYRIKNCINNLNFTIKNTKIDKLTEDEKELLEEAKIFKKCFEEYMDDDFNTAGAISEIFNYVKFTNINNKDDSSKEFISRLKEEILFLCDILGLKIKEKDEIDEEEINRLIKEREEARKNKDFKTADKIRDELNSMNIIIEDTPSGARWIYKDV